MDILSTSVGVLIRSLKAIMRDGTEDDEKIYNEIEAEIQAKREEIRGLENGN